MAKFDFGGLGAATTTTTTNAAAKVPVRHLGEVALNDGPLVIRGLIKALGGGPLTLAGFTAKKDFEKAALVIAAALLQGGHMTAEKIRDIERLSRSKNEDRGRKRSDGQYDQFRDSDPDSGEEGFNVRLLRWMLVSIGELPILIGEEENPPEFIKEALENAKAGEEPKEPKEPKEPTTATATEEAKASKAKKAHSKKAGK